MNIKKISALGAAVIMMFSAVANAAIPTVDELKARTPNIEVVVGNKITTVDGFKELSSAEYPEDVYNENKDIYDFYKVTMNVSDLGYLANQRGEIVAVSAVSLDIKDNDFQKDTSGNKTGIFGALDLHGDKISSGKTVEGGAASAGYGLNEGYFCLSWAIKDNDVVYPNSGTIDNATLSIDYVIAIKAGTSIQEYFKTSDYKSEITYRYGTAKTTTRNVGNTIATLGASKLAIKAKGILTTDNGCIWDVDLTNASKINKFDATFKATGAEEAKRTVRNISGLVLAVGGTGSLNLKVGVVTDTTTKSNITACFDVADSDGKTATTGDIAAAAAKSE